MKKRQDKNGIYFARRTPWTNKLGETIPAQQEEREYPYATVVYGVDNEDYLIKEPEMELNEGYPVDNSTPKEELNAVHVKSNRSSDDYYTIEHHTDVCSEITGAMVLGARHIDWVMKRYKNKNRCQKKPNNSKQ